MRFTVGLPVDRVDRVEEFVTGAAVAEMAAAAEAVGFDAAYVTDHPAPDDRWLEGGGHHALEPMVALAYVAASTRTLRLHTHVYVAAYRNPFLAAKSILSLDVLSGGRVILGVATGYLRPEFGALGVDFDERNDLLDEALDVMRRVWTEDSVAFEGKHFRARGVTMRPKPLSQPHPAIWIGGNSARAMRRAVESAEGWSPFPNPPGAVGAVRTPSITTVDDLAERLDAARAHAKLVGRTRPLDVCFAPLAPYQADVADGKVGVLQGEIEALERAGVTWLAVQRDAVVTRAEWLEWIHRFGEHVIRAR